ncbi:MAG: hypothetical protein HFJ37_05915 [Clostridia bacterium]|nr:hypothetical protein [Clostridia bacterium]
MINYEEINRMMDKTSKIPYPKIPDLYPNSRYARMIQEDFAGKDGELTAITQYIYEHINFSDKEKLSLVLKRIAIEEMRHLDILGEIIKKLGGKAHYINSNEDQWTAKNVNYNIENLKEIMRYNILSEEKAIMGYRKAMRYTNNIQLRRVFERIIIDENMHKEIFKSILEGMN